MLNSCSAFTPLEIDAHPVGHAAVMQGLDQRLIGVMQAGIFADNGDMDRSVGIADPVGHLAPAFHAFQRTRWDEKSSMCQLRMLSKSQVVWLRPSSVYTRGGACHGHTRNTTRYMHLKVLAT
eukprot:TRINITY_DN104594_c0_g1_i1.p2 TRINITY_DN104594_c0_g1~~TRINITY_DN104594_c0_g1_i1.p2  ORF type:complete len:122 (+),score=7.45 TRINITY_DN104594_c0_g1_i1:2-367(+)